MSDDIKVKKVKRLKVPKKPKQLTGKEEFAPGRHKPNVTVKARLVGKETQPISKVEWTPRDKLHSNNYNPNQVFAPEMNLLKISIMEDGWTQPIVARRDGEIIDGFHRWTVSADADVAAMTGGLVPVVFLDLGAEHQMMSTIRHNRARGSHHVIKMAEIVAKLSKSGMSPEDIGARLQMEDEEVERLLDNSGMVLGLGAKVKFNSAWVPSAD